jgi:pimeloyl-ACP methyl ester carboxylesterase
VGVILILAFVAPAGTPAEGDPVRVQVPIAGSGEVDLGELVVRLAAAAGLELPRPSGGVTLPMAGLAGSLSRQSLADGLGPGARVSVEGKRLVVTIDPAALAPGRRADWERRVRDLAARAEREARRRLNYGMHARPSYRPNDPRRPTVCLVHGVNSSSGGFVHMFGPLEEAGYGVVAFDYPYNRSLEDSCRRFGRDWAAFRRETEDKQPWVVVGHSMGCLVARDYVEGPFYGGDVSALVMIAPVNQGSHLAKTQTLLQLINGLRAVGGRRPSDALARLGDGLGEAADDMLPGSAFLKGLNARPRRAGVAYHTLAGDVGILTAAARRQIEAQAALARRQGGLLGGLVRAAAGSPETLSDRLDEITDGTGDGCVSVARTRLAGVADHVVIHANHAELIRAPLLYPDPGPVACMPQLLRWLAAARPAAAPGP